MKRNILIIAPLFFLLVAAIFPNQKTVHANPLPPPVYNLRAYEQTMQQWEGLYCVPTSESSTEQQAQTQMVSIAKQMETLNNETTITPQLMVLTNKYFGLMAQYDTCSTNNP